MQHCFMFSAWSGDFWRASVSGKEDSVTCSCHYRQRWIRNRQVSLNSWSFCCQQH